MKCNCKQSNGWTTIACCNDCKRPLRTEPWDIPSPIKKSAIKFFLTLFSGITISCMIMFFVYLVVKAF